MAIDAARNVRLTDLPYDVLYYTFSFLPARHGELLGLVNTCKLLYDFMLPRLLRDIVLLVDSNVAGVHAVVLRRPVDAKEIRTITLTGSPYGGETARRLAEIVARAPGLNKSIWDRSRKRP